MELYAQKQGIGMQAQSSAGFYQGLLSLLGPLFIGKATDCLIGVNAVNFSDTLKNILLLAGIYLCSAVFLWLMNIFANALHIKQAICCAATHIFT